MHCRAKQDYRRAIQARYRQSDKGDKQKILDEFCEVCGYHRKYAIAALSQAARVQRKTGQKPGPKPRYQDKAVMRALQRIWHYVNLACAKRLKAALPFWLPYYSQHYEALSADTQRKLLEMSAASIDRLLKPVRDTLEIKRRSQTRPGTLPAHQIPLKQDFPWNPNRPGFVEADTVSHCGGAISGNYVWSLTLTDIKTTWTENRAVWNKGSAGVVASIQDIEKHLPFPLLGFNCDSGYEFLNHHLIRYFQKGKLPSFAFTRSRPGKKNDNAHVEQKNWTHVRHLFGYERLGDAHMIDSINSLYSQEWRAYQNFFIPTMQLIEKVRIGSRYRKKYDAPRTPYQRVLEEPTIANDQKAKLTALYRTLDPFALKQAIEVKRKRILQSARAQRQIERVPAPINQHTLFACE